MADFLKEFAQDVDRKNLTVFGVAVQQHGQFIEEYRWTPDVPHILHSLSKSYTVSAVGMAIEEGLFAITDRVVDLFPEEAPRTVSPLLAAMTVRDLLVMAPGHDQSLMLSHQRDTIPDSNWVRYYLAQPLDRMPGERFVYDSACTYLLSALLEKVTGEHLVDYLMPRLFVPLGLDRKPQWETCPRGITLGCAGLYLRTREILPFGQLYLQHGQWEGKQLIPVNWVKECTRKQIDNQHSSENADNQCGYGYQFWMCRHGAYRGDGMNGQFCIVIPSVDAVVAINSNEPNAQSILDSVWDCILPNL